MLDPAIIDAMVSSGCSVETLAAAVKAAAIIDKEKVLERRHYDTMRQRAWRQKKKDEQNQQERHCDLPLQTVTSPSSPLSSPPKERTKENNPPYNPPTNLFRTVAKATRTSGSYSDEFETKFWSPYPRTPPMSKQETWKAWMKLNAMERLAACEAVPAYKSYLRSKPDLPTVHACRFLSQRRFEGFAVRDGPDLASRALIVTPRTPLPVLDVKPAGALT